MTDWWKVAEISALVAGRAESYPADRAMHWADEYPPAIEAQRGARRGAAIVESVDGDYWLEVPEVREWYREHG